MAEIMTAREAARIADVTTQYISYLINEGEIKAERFGRAWAIDRASFDAWFAKRRQRQAEQGDQGGERDQGEAEQSDQSEPADRAEARA